MKFKDWLVEDIKSFTQDTVAKVTIKSVLRGVVNGCIQNILKCKPLFDDILAENYLQDIWAREDLSRLESTRLFNKFIIDNQSFLSQIESLFNITRDGTKVYHGGEGIVYPFKGKEPNDLQMVKFIVAPGGGAEFKIANKMKGHHLVPVLHTFKLIHHNFDKHQIVLYGFVSKRLIASRLESFVKNIEDIASTFEGIIDEFESIVHDKTLSWQSIPYEEPGDAKKIKVKKSEINNLFKQLEQSISDRPPEDQKVGNEILTIIKTIHDKTGFIFGRDFTAGFGSVSNIGLTPTAQIQPYDFGLSVAVSKKATEAATGFPTIELR